MTNTLPTHSGISKKHLRRIGHHLSPVVTVASKGLTPGVLSEVERALKDHELIKVRLSVGDRSARKDVGQQLSEQCEAEIVQTIGGIILLFKKANQPDPKLSNLLR